jgi:hypothetical protein
MFDFSFKDKVAELSGTISQGLSELSAKTRDLRAPGTIHPKESKLKQIKIEGSAYEVQ